MGLKLYEETSVQAIADAIRAKNGSSDTYTISEMSTAIGNIPSGGGGGTHTETKTVTFLNTTTPFNVGDDFLSGYGVYSQDSSYALAIAVSDGVGFAARLHNGVVDGYSGSCTYSNGVFTFDSAFVQNYMGSSVYSLNCLFNDGESPKAPTGYNRTFREGSMEFQFDPNGKIKSVWNGGSNIGGTIQGVSDLNGTITSLHITGSITDSYEYNNKTGFERCQFIVGFTDQRWDSTILVGYNDYGSAYIKEEITLTNQQEVNDIDILIDLTDPQYEQYASIPKYFFISLLGISGEFDVTLE